MRPRRLVLESIHSFRGRHEVDLTQTSCAVASGGNGNGKSTLVVDAPLYALFGETRGDANSIVTEGEQVGRVEFEFALGPDVYLVSRQRSKKGAGRTTTSFQKLTAEGPIVLDGKGEVETQQRIEQTLHMTADLLRAAAFSTQGNAAAFCEASRADRRAVLGDIVGLGEWERRAEIAREWTRRTDSEIAGQEVALTQARARGEAIPQIEQQAAELEQQLNKLAESLNETAELLNATQGEREKLIAEQAADKAARASLVEARQRQNDATSATERARRRVNGITEATARRQAAVDALKAAETYATEVIELEAKRQERERIAGEGRELDEKIKGARTEHTAAVQQLTALIASARRERESKLKVAADEIALLRKQTEVLDSVPCAAAGNTPLVDACPLIAQAREAKERIPQLEQFHAGIETSTPWAEDEQRLELLQAKIPASDLIAKRNRLGDDYKAIQYDPEAHAQAKRCAASLSEHQADLATIDAQAALLPGAQSELEAAQEELARISERVQQLESVIGLERDWDDELETLGRQAQGLQERQAQNRREIEMAQQRSGQLAEQLAGAREAQQQSEQLAKEITELRERLNLLKILSQAYSKAGVPALLIELAIPELERVANDVLSTLSDGRLALQLRSQRETKSKTVQEVLDIIVLDERGERAYENFSGGERMRVDIAVRAALSSLLATRAGARCELLVLDETCAPLDAEGRLQFVECLGRLSDRFACILVVTHCEELKELFPCRLEITKGAEGSRVEVFS